MADETGDSSEDVIANPDPHFEPIVNLAPVQTKTLEEDEEELVKLRAKLYRYDTSAEPREWKERGTGDVKILRHLQLGTCRVLMRRDKTLKVCANHHVLPHLELKPNCDSDKAWVWSTPADFADEEPKQELLAIRFGTAENAQKFHKVFEDAKVIMSKLVKGDATADHDDEGDDDSDDDDHPECDKTASDKLSKNGKKEKNQSEASEKENDALTSDLEKLKVTDEKTNKVSASAEEVKDSPTTNQDADKQ